MTLVEKPKKLLIITSSGGGGLLQTATAKEQEARVQDPSVIIIRKDVMKDWVWETMGNFFVHRWNTAQIQGNVAFQSFCAWAQKIVEYVLWPNYFFCALYTFFKEDIDRVIDTQPIGTAPIIRAMRIFNRMRNKQLRLEKVLVDLPTKKATHFFHPIKKLSKKSRKCLKLVTIDPLLEEGQTKEEFWQTHCKLSDTEVHYEDVYVRQAFKKYQGVGKATEAKTLKVRFKSPEELHLMKKTFGRGSISFQEGSHDLHFHIGPQDRVATVLLGSQPASEATLNYVKGFIELAQLTSSGRTPIHLFVFCADFHGPLFKKVTDWVASVRNYPKHLSIIPFGFQSDDVIAPLFSRSDLTCTRSGGQTAMELICVSNGEMWIHSETKPKHEELTLDDLLAGIPGWESASAAYLHKLHGAKIVTPYTFLSHAVHVFKERTQLQPKFKTG